MTSFKNNESMNMNRDEEDYSDEEELIPISRTPLSDSDIIALQ